MAQILFVLGVTLACYGMSLLTVMSANPTGGPAADSSLTYLFIGMLGSSVIVALRSQHDRIKRLEQCKTESAASR